MKTESILVIIMRSNGDVYLSLPVIAALRKHYPRAKVDLLVSQSTFETAHAMHVADHIHVFRYDWKEKGRTHYLLKQLSFMGTIFRKYDLSISLTASDRSNLYAIISGRRSLGAYDSGLKTSWWKRILLDGSYLFDQRHHIVQNNVEPLKLLGIGPKRIEVRCRPTEAALERVKALLRREGIGDYLIFHPSTAHSYKVYPRRLRNRLLEGLGTLGLSIVVTGGTTPLDRQISGEIPDGEHLHNFIGRTSLEDTIALTRLAKAYIGMDTLNMHIAASQDIRVFAIFGPTRIHRWSPWSNVAQTAAVVSKPVQRYGNVTVFQADLPCVPCGLQGCRDDFGHSQCLHEIDPETVLQEVRQWLTEGGKP